MDKYTREKVCLEQYLQKRGISYNQKTKRWRCPCHDDQHESAILYKNNDGYILSCPVCGVNLNIFAVCSILDNIKNDKEHFPELLKRVHDVLNITNIKRTEQPKNEKKNLKKIHVHFRAKTNPLLMIKYKKFQKIKIGERSKAAGNTLILMGKSLPLMLDLKIKMNVKI